MNNIKLKRTLFDVFKITISAYGIIIFLINPNIATQSILKGLQLCYTSIIPALFPFFVFSKIIMHSKFAHVLGILLYPYTRFVLKIKQKNVATAVLLGLIGGFGCGAVCLQTLYDKKLIHIGQAYTLLCFIINAGPAFVVVGVGTNMINSPFTGWLIYISLCLASLITGGFFSMFFKFKNADTLKETNVFKSSINKENADKGSFVNCVSEAVYATLTLCGFVVLFSFIIASIELYNLPFYANLFLAVFLEVTVANSLIAQSENAYAVYFCCAAISLMGASIVLQMRSLLPKQISLTPLIISRIVHTPLAVLILYILMQIFKNAVPVSVNNIYTLNMPIEAVCAFVFFCCSFFCALYRPAKIFKH